MLLPDWLYDRYLTNHHYAEVRGWWIEFGFSVESMVKCQRGLMGKWESQGIAAQQLLMREDKWRLFCQKVDHLLTNPTSRHHTTLRKDVSLFLDMLTNPRIWFQFLVSHDYHNHIVNPLFFWSKATSDINPASGPHFRRQDCAVKAAQTIALINRYEKTYVNREGNAQQLQQSDIREDFPTAYYWLKDQAGVGVGNLLPTWAITPDGKQKLVQEEIPKLVQGMMQVTLPPISLQPQSPSLTLS